MARPSRPAVVILVVFGLIGGLLLASKPGTYPNLHTILDTGVGLLSGILALKLWGAGQREGGHIARRLALVFLATFAMEMVHVLVTVEWSGPLAPIKASSGVLRPSTWPPPSHLLPLGVIGALLWPTTRRSGLATFASAVLATAIVLFAVYQRLPTYLPPGPLGITRPTLILAPMFWIAAGLLAWRLADGDRVVRALPMTAVILAAANALILYSRSPADAPAMASHLGKMAGELTLLFFLFQTASRDMGDRVRVETALSQLNAELDQRVAERTAQLEAETQARQKGQRLLEAVVENSPAVIYVKDLDGRYLMVNRRYGDIFHIDRDAMIGRTDHDIFPLEIADAFRTMDVRVAAADQPLTEEESAPHDDGPHAYISVKSPLRDETGQVYAVFGISTDITERKDAEAKLHTQLQRMGLLDEITRAIGERQDNQSIFQVVVRSIEDQLPADFACLCLYDDLERALTVAAVGVNSQALALELAMPERAQVDIDENGLSQCVRGRLVYEPDIAQVPFPFPRRLAGGGLGSMVCAPLQVESKVFGVLVVARFQPNAFVSAECEFLRQLSEHVALAAHQAQLHSALQAAYDDLRQSQQAILQQERLKALGQMASGIAHDINNALSPVSLYTEAMIETEPGLSAAGRGQLEIIRRAVEDVGQTIGKMREFYRLRETQLETEPVQLNQLVGQVLELTRARWNDMAMQRGVVIAVETALADDLPAVMGVASEIREALVNLVFNAIDAMPDGGVLTVNTARLATDVGDAVRVSVADNGIGMDAEARRRCLEPFFTTKGERGTGLGLAMVYGVAQRHGAELDVQSSPGAGATISLTFARAMDDRAAPNTPAAVPRRRLRLLLVDDDPVLLKALSDALESDGHVVTIANGGGAGIEAFEASQGGDRFDAVFTDLGMPYVDGRRVAAAIKGLSATTPVILLTGWGQGLLADDDVPPHIDLVLSKPPKLRELRAALARFTT
ncbi:PAS domain S-box-containing protein [Caulobacter rhizosphaerae]|uniref:histidine kinase n=1 Tax=Caulobacter rhizosphaerae TaxID=2010972 RepID=A0ABU1N5R0_9CAUL|nr:PAS domain-containing protein [Caulobacter rhizosphaerae]MDR6533764.1 PAS domain S-box-containing protein [Caulobacter rhizosphaerae]